MHGGDGCVRCHAAAWCSGNSHKQQAVNPSQLGQDMMPGIKHRTCFLRASCCLALAMPPGLQVSIRCQGVRLCTTNR
jgi:hypothetical protein